MSQIFIDPGFHEKPDSIFCSEKCVSDAGLYLNAPNSNIFPITQDKFHIQKDIMGWGDICSNCGKPLSAE